MTANEIRASYVEVIEQHATQPNCDGHTECACGQSFPTWREWSPHLADALAAAGLLPTGKEWAARVAWPGTERAEYIPCSSKDVWAVRDTAARAGSATVMHRYTHDWREADASTGRGEKETAGGPLSPERVQELPEGQPITVIWSGGNGPHRYLVAVDRRGRRYASMESDFADERLRYYNPLTFVGAEKFHTRVWLGHRTQEADRG